MNADIHLEHRAGSSQGKHEGEPSLGLCDRLNRTRDNSQRQLPTDHDYAVPTREYQTDQSSLKTAPTAARSVFGKGQKQRQRQKQPHSCAELTRSLHIRPPITARPIGAFCSPPSPRARAIGNMPMIIASAVMQTGRSRVVYRDSEPLASRPYSIRPHKGRVARISSTTRMLVCGRNTDGHQRPHQRWHVERRLCQEQHPYNPRRKPPEAP